MHSRDEETPLLQSACHGKKKSTPLPWFQFSLTLFLQLVEPLTAQVIYPFMPELIRDLGVTGGNESQVGYYVGVVESIFFLTQACTVLHWSSISDRVGRKPVILTGLFGLSVSMYCFGLSRTFLGLVVSRSLNGALNGNIGVMKSVVSDMTDDTNISKAYAYIPIAWSTGATLGPIIGGSLSRPAERFPQLFGNNDFLKQYPYFLPCAIPATFSAVAWLLALLFLKETLPAPICPASYFNLRKGTAPQNVAGSQDPSVTETSIATVQSHNEKPLPFRALLTRRVMLAAANYASLSLVDIAFRAIQPLFLATPIHLGGLGLPPSTIGKILSVFGVLNGLFQMFFFAGIHDRWGSKKVFTAGVASAIPAFACFPVINYLARVSGYSNMLWALVGFQTVVSIGLGMSYGAIFIFISAASPNRASLGATNGISQTTVSLMRAIGPALANSLFSLSMEKGYLGGNLVYYLLLIVVGIALGVASLLPSHMRMA